MPALTTENWTFLEDDSDTKDKNPNYLATITYIDEGGAQQTIVANLPQEFSVDMSAGYESSLAQGIGNIPMISQASGIAKNLGVQALSQSLTAQIWQGASELTFSLPLVFHVNNDEVTDLLKPVQQLYSLILPGEAGASGILTAPGPSLEPFEAAGGLLKDFSTDIAAGAKLGINNVANALGFEAGVKSRVNNVANALGFEGTLMKSSSGSSANTSNVDAKPSAPKKDSPLISRVKNRISLDIGTYMRFAAVVVTSVAQRHQVQPLASGTMSKVEVDVGFKTFFTLTKKDIGRIFVKSVL